MASTGIDEIEAVQAALVAAGFHATDAEIALLTATRADLQKMTERTRIALELECQWPSARWSADSDNG
jgi:hypothetical protein